MRRHTPVVVLLLGVMLLFGLASMPAQAQMVVKDINPGGDSIPIELTDVNGTLFFLANDGATGHELWKSDGTEAGTLRVSTNLPLRGIRSLTNVNGTLFFRADNDLTGVELWVNIPLDPTEPLDTVLHGAMHNGRDGLSDLYRIDTQTGTATRIGPIGFERVGAMDVDAAGTLYAIGERNDGSDIMVLITIDPITGAGTEVGPTGLQPEGDPFTIINDISFHPTDGRLIGFFFNGLNNNFDRGLIELDPAVGASSIIALAAPPIGGAGNGLAFDVAETLIFARGGPVSNPDNGIYTGNPSTGVFSFVTGFSFLETVTTPRINGMDVHPNSRVLYGSLVDGEQCCGGTRTNSLATVEPATGSVSVIGPTVDGLDALAFVDVDADDDGLADGIDPLPTTFSNNFSDAGLGGAPTFGDILDRGDQTLIILKEPTPDGVRLKTDASGGTNKAQVKFCGIVTLSFGAGSDTNVTCGSATINVIAGTVDITFEGDAGQMGTTNLAAGNEVTFEATTFSFTVPESNEDPVVVLVDGGEITLEPGETGQGVDIEIVNGNAINPNSNQKVKVVILSTAGFDAITVDVSTVTAGDPALAQVAHAEPETKAKDHNGDGLDDLEVSFRFKNTGALDTTTPDIQVQGETNDGTVFFGTTSVTIKP